MHMPLLFVPYVQLLKNITKHVGYGGYKDTTLRPRNCVWSESAACIFCSNFLMWVKIVDREDKVYVPTLGCDHKLWLVTETF